MDAWRIRTFRIFMGPLFTSFKIFPFRYEYFHLHYYGNHFKKSCCCHIKKMQPLFFYCIMHIITVLGFIHVKFKENGAFQVKFQKFGFRGIWDTAHPIFVIEWHSCHKLVVLIHDYLIISSIPGTKLLKFDLNVEMLHFAFLSEF